MRFLRFLLLGAACLLAGPQGLHAATPPDHWVGTWAAAPMAASNPTGSFGVGGKDGTTLRQIVHVSLGGAAVRIVLSNEFGLDPLTVGATAIALRSDGSGIVAGTALSLTFGGRSSVTIPPGALVVSDAAMMKLPAFSDVAVTTFLPAQPVTQLTFHPFADQTSYFAAGNVLNAARLDSPTEIYTWDFLKGVDVQAGADSGSVVAFGDSITDGAHSTRNANARWPDVLARRLAGNKKTAQLGVLNEGIVANRILHDKTGPKALARFDRDVLAQSGVKYVVLLEGINDIGEAADPVKPQDVISAEDVIAGLTQLAERAHMHGIKVYGATLTPYLGAKHSSPKGETMRQAVNQWIRTTGKLDGVIDFDKAISDPAHPAMFVPANDSGDHLHPGDTGYKAMGESIDLKLFEK